MKNFLFFALFAFPLCAGAAFAASEPPARSSPVAALRPPAQPVSALFYPRQVQLTVEERLGPEALPGHGRGFLLVLPAVADPSSFAVTLDGLPAGGFSWLDPERDPQPQGSAAAAPATRPEEESDPGRRALLQTLLFFQDKADSLAADLDTLDLRISLWRENDGEDKTLKAEDRLKMDAAFKDLLPALFKARSAGERLQKENDRRFQEAEKALRDYDRKHGRRLALIPSELPDGRTALLRYTYILPGSCRAAYDINALPAKDSLTVAQSASLIQTSGFAWKNVEIFISTSGRDIDLDPQPLPPWQIQLDAPALLRERAAPKPSPALRSQMSVNLAQAPGADSEPGTAGAYAEEEEKGAFRLWSLGKRSIDTDVATTVPLAFNEYSARFHYTLRPSQSARGFLSAALSLDQALELPLGQARFFVDAVFVGEKPLSLNGKAATLHFGADPQVVVTRVDQKRSSGEQGILSKEQTLLWHWDFIVRNTRNRLVEAWVEDPFPDALDSAVSVNVVSSPKPEEEVLSPLQGGAKTYRWKLSLPPGEVRTISHRVTVSAPADKHLDPGR